MKTLILSLVITGALFAQTTATLAPVPKQQFFSATGQPLNGGLVYTYQAGTTTPQASYTDSTGTTSNANPIVLDSAGRAAIWLGQSHAYKIVLEDSAFNVIWTIDNIADSGVLAMQALALSTGATRVGYSNGATGGVTRTIQSKLNDTIDLDDFGAVCSGIGTSDDHLAILAAIAYVQTFNGGTINFPRRPCNTSVTIRLPSFVRFKGTNSTNTQINAYTGFPTGVPLICFGNTSCTDGTPVYGTSIEDMTLNCQNTVGSIGYQAPSSEEMTYMQWVNIYGCYVGMNLIGGYGNQNTRYEHMTVNTGAFVDGIPIIANNLTGHALFEDFTISGAAPSGGGECTLNQSGTECANSPGFFLGGSTTTTIRGVHCESVHTCIMVVGGNTNMIEDIGSTLGNVAVDVYLCGGRAGGPASHKCPAGSGGAGALIHSVYGIYAHIIDDMMGISICTGGPGCSTLANSTGNREIAYQPFGVGTYDTTGQNNTILSSVPSAFELFSALITNNLTLTSNAALVFNHEQMGDMGNGGYYANTGSSNPQGLTIQSGFTPHICGTGYPSGTAPCVGTTGGGGLFLNGNGVQGDAAYGAVTAGSFNDGSTHTADATTAAGMVLNDGVGYLFANASLTRGTIFTPTPAIIWAPSLGLTFPGLTSLTGTRTLCVDTGGHVTASASPCSGT